MVTAEGVHMFVRATAVLFLVLALQLGLSGPLRGQTVTTQSVSPPSAPVQASSTSTPVAGMNLDLTSTARNLGPGNMVNNRPTSILVGQTSVPVTPSSLLSAAERLAVYQMISTGRQSILISPQGNAVGGTLTLGPKFAQYVSSLVVAPGVTAVRDSGTAGALSLAGDLTNGGAFYALSTNASVTNALISANNITNLQGAIMSSVVPASVLASFPGAVATLDLVLSTKNLQNAGVISSSGSLTAIASETITNALPSGVSGSVPLMQANNDVSLTAQNLIDRGAIISQPGKLTVNVLGVTPPTISDATAASNGTLTILSAGSNSTTNSAVAGAVTLTGAGSGYLSASSFDVHSTVLNVGQASANLGNISVTNAGTFYASSTTDRTLSASISNQGISLSTFIAPLTVPSGVTAPSTFTSPGGGTLTLAASLPTSTVPSVLAGSNAVNVVSAAPPSITISPPRTLNSSSIAVNLPSAGSVTTALASLPSTGTVTVVAPGAATGPTTAPTSSPSAAPVPTPPPATSTGTVASTNALAAGTATVPTAASALAAQTTVNIGGTGSITVPGTVTAVTVQPQPPTMCCGPSMPQPATNPGTVNVISLPPVLAINVPASSTGAPSLYAGPSPSAPQPLNASPSSSTISINAPSPGTQAGLTVSPGNIATQSTLGIIASPGNVGAQSAAVLIAGPGNVGTQSAPLVVASPGNVGAQSGSANVANNGTSGSQSGAVTILSTGAINTPPGSSIPSTAVSLSGAGAGASAGGSIDLSSASPAGSLTLNAGQSITVVNGGAASALRTSALVTAAQSIAVNQVLKTGMQSIVLSSQGNAIGGTLLLGRDVLAAAGSISIPAGVKAVQIAPSASSLTLQGASGSGGAQGNLINPASALYQHAATATSSLTALAHIAGIPINLIVPAGTTTLSVTAPSHLPLTSYLPLTNLNTQARSADLQGGATTLMSLSAPGVPAFGLQTPSVIYSGNYNGPYGNISFIETASPLAEALITSTTRGKQIAQFICKETAQVVHTAKEIRFSGEALVAALDDISVVTDFGEVLMRKGAMAHLTCSSDRLVVRACSAARDTRIVAGGRSYCLGTAEELLITDHQPAGAESSPADGIGRRCQQVLPFGNGIFGVKSEISLVSMIRCAPELANLAYSSASSERKLFARLLRTSAAVDVVLHANGNYHANPLPQPAGKEYTAVRGPGQNARRLTSI